MAFRRAQKEKAGRSPLRLLTNPVFFETRGFLCLDQAKRIVAWWACRCGWILRDSAAKSVSRR